MILIIILYALFASSFVISKEMLHYTTPIFLVGIRMILGGLILLGYQILYKKEKIRCTAEDLKYYLFIGITGIYVSYTFRYWSLVYLPTTKAYFLSKTAPFFTAIFSYFIFKEKLNSIQWLALCIGFIGLAPILLGTTPLETHLNNFSFISVAEMFALISVALYALSKIFVRKLVRDKEQSAALVNGVTMLIGGTMALITSLIYEPCIPISCPLKFFSLLALAILVSNIICYSLYAHLLTKYTATLISLTGFSSIFFSAFYGWLFFGETITVGYCASAIIVFIALMLFYHEETKRHSIINR